ncbi:MAG: L,D-transpeptidase family protein [Alphaproteobacteria bacterium]
MNRRQSLRGIVFLAAGALSFLPSPSHAEPDVTAVSQSIRAAIEAERARARGPADDLSRIYAAGGFAPIWSLSPGAADRAAILARVPEIAAREGLDPTRYAGRPAAHGDDAASVAARDLAETEAFLHFVQDVRAGAVSPDGMGRDWSILPDPFDAAEAAGKAVRDGTLATFIELLPPPHPAYRRLAGTLAAYDAIAAAGGWPLVGGDAELLLGSGDPREASLRERLRIEGDLALEQSGAQDQDALRDAVRRFQTRHGLSVDGRVGRATLRALQIGAKTRADQIRANLERWRHLPRDFGARHVEVNVADQSAVLKMASGDELAMRAIVGDPKHPTPVLSARILAVTLNPPWNVPVSIATKEFLPKLQRNPGYLEAHEIVIANRAGGDPYGRDIDWKAVGPRGFPYTFRQLPGPRNSLGVVKLEMPNPFDVYLHDTPTKALFERSQRYFSHGCVRLERAIDMAVAVIANEAEWNRDSIGAAIRTDATRRIDLGSPVPVFLLYWTAFVTEAGQVNFREDVYGRDRPLIAALSAAAGTDVAASGAAPGGCPET